MYCGNCGCKINNQHNFCPNCGSNIQLIRDKVIEFNNVYSNIQTNQNSMQDLNVNVSTNNKKTHRILNYEVGFELALAIINTILSSLLCYFVCMAVALLIFIPLVMIFGGSKALIKMLNESGNYMTFILFIFVIMLAINAIMFYLFYKKNKNNPVKKEGIKVNKIKYLLLIWFLGIIGVHRFVIKDKKGSKFRLLLLILVVLLTVIFSQFNGIIAVVPIFILIGCNLGLALTDFIIALAQKSDNDKNILV